MLTLILFYFSAIKTYFIDMYSFCTFIDTFYGLSLLHLLRKLLDRRSKWFT